MAAALTVAVGSDYKSIVINVTALTGGAYTTAELWVLRPGATVAEKLDASLTVASFTYYFHSDSSINTTATSPIVFTDGVWQFYIYEADAGVTVELTSSSAYGFCTGNVRCCLGVQIGKLATKSFDEDCCQDCLTQEIYTMYILLDSATFDASSTCGDYSKAQKKIDKITAYCAQDDDCKQSNCNDCN
jgi:hypothetical protein